MENNKKQEQCLTIYLENWKLWKVVIGYLEERCWGNLNCICRMFLSGLYGKNGVLPAHTQLETKDSNVVHNIHNKPTLLWLAPYIGLDTEYMMDVLSLTGIFLSFTG